MKAKPKKQDPADAISEMLELANSMFMDDDALDGDITDAASCKAIAEAAAIQRGPLIGKIEYLYESGYSMARLRKLILGHSNGG